jgi:hypothetical protein
MYKDLKGPDANSFSARLQNHVESGGDLSLPQLGFMKRWIDANSPLQQTVQPTGEIGYTRTPPVSMQVLAALGRHGVTVPGLELANAPPAGTAASGAPPGQEGAPSAYPMPQGGPQFGWVNKPQMAIDQKQAEAIRSDPLWQNAEQTQASASGVLRALADETTFGDRAALAAVIKTILPSARAGLATGSEAEADIASKQQLWWAELEKMLSNKNRTLDPIIRKQIADFAIGQAATTKANYDARYEPLRTAWRQRGGNADMAIPVIQSPSAPPNLTVPSIAGQSTPGQIGQPTPTAGPTPNRPVLHPLAKDFGL